MGEVKHYRIAFVNPDVTDDEILEEFRQLLEDRGERVVEGTQIGWNDKGDGKEAPISPNVDYSNDKVIWFEAEVEEVDGGSES